MCYCKVLYVPLTVLLQDTVCACSMCYCKVLYVPLTVLLQDTLCASHYVTARYCVRLSHVLLQDTVCICCMCYWKIPFAPVACVSAGFCVCLSLY